MRLLINDFEWNDPAKRIYIDEPVEGLELTKVRTSAGANTGQHGGYTGAQQRDVRAVTIPGHIFADTVSEALSKRREMNAVFKLYPEVNVVRIIDDDGSVYTFDATYIDFMMPIERSRLRSNYKIELRADDPVIYDDAAGAALEAIITQVIPGGVQFTDTSPLFDSFYFSEGQAASTIVNSTEVPSKPIITINGQTTDPVFTNRTTGESFRLVGYATGPDAVTVIDMAAHTVTLDGGNAFAYAPSDVDWWALVEGPNEIEFTSGSGSDETQAPIKWRPGYWGI